MKTFGAREFNQPVLIERKATSRNVIGEEIVVWVKVCDVPAKANPLRGREFFAAGGLQQESITRFVIRYQDGINENMRLTWRGEHYNIGSVIDVDGAMRYIELMTTKGVNDG